MKLLEAEAMRRTCWSNALLGILSELLHLYCGIPDVAYNHEGREVEEVDLQGITRNVYCECSYILLCNVENSEVVIQKYNQIRAKDGHKQASGKRKYPNDNSG